MSGFISFMGYATIVLCMIGGGYICVTGPNSLMGLGLELIVAGGVSGSLLLGFAALLDWVQGIHDSLVDTVDGKASGWYHPATGAPTLFYYVLNRTAGKWGAAYAIEGSGDRIIAASFSSKEKVMAGIRADIASLLAIKVAEAE